MSGNCKKSEMGEKVIAIAPWQLENLLLNNFRNVVFFRIRRVRLPKLAVELERQRFVFCSMDEDFFL